jgi:hypothetical protein
MQTRNFELHIEKATFDAKYLLGKWGVTVVTVFQENIPSYPDFIDGDSSNRYCG